MRMEERKMKDKKTNIEDGFHLGGGESGLCIGKFASEVEYLLNNLKFFLFVFSNLILKLSDPASQCLHLLFPFFVQLFDGIFQYSRLEVTIIPFTELLARRAVFSLYFFFLFFFLRFFFLFFLFFQLNHYFFAFFFLLVDFFLDFLFFRLHFDFFLFYFVLFLFFEDFHWLGVHYFRYYYWLFFLLFLLY